MALGGATGTAFVARADIAGWPLVGWLAKQNATLFVSRSERGAVHGQIGALRAAMARHQPITLFPEGTTGDGHALLPFKAPLFATFAAPAPRDPGAAGIDRLWRGDGCHCLDRGGAGGRQCAAGPVAAWHYRADLAFPRTLRSRAHPDRKALAAETRSRIAAALHALRGTESAV